MNDNRPAPAADPMTCPDSRTAISVRGLRRSYGALEALAGIDLEIAHGEIFALLGPNGAGKTTTIEILEGFRTRSGGIVDVLGEDPEHAGGAWRQRIGVVLQDTHPEPELTARECLSLYAGYYDDPRDPHDTLELVGLAEQADVRCEHLSGGQRRRLDVALALIGDPELLFLDEPTTGFDPAARRAAWDVILGLRALGKTIVLTTHYMEEAERLADRIAVITAGRLVAIGTPRTLGAAHLTATRITFTLPPGIEGVDLPEAFAQAEIDGRRVAQLRTTDAIPALHALAAWAIAHNHDLADLEVRRPTLEDVYLNLTAPRDEAVT